MRHRTGTRGKALEKLIVLALVLAFIFFCTIVRSEEPTMSFRDFQDQMTKQERRAIAIAAVANLIRRQNVYLQMPPNTYRETVSENAYPLESTHNPYPLPSPYERNWSVMIEDETIANPDKWSFWAAKTKTVYHLQNDNGEEARVTLEWK